MGETVFVELVSMVNVLPVLPPPGKPANEAGTGSLTYMAICDTVTVLLTSPIDAEIVAERTEAHVFSNTSNVTVHT